MRLTSRTDTLTDGAAGNFDGGVVEYSTDNGVSWQDAGGLISSGAFYGGTISTGFQNPLAGRSAFVKESFGYTASQLDLGSLSGQTVRFRFRIGTDRDVGTLPGGWYVDDIRLYTCVNSVPMFSAVLPAGRSVQVGSTATAFVVVNAGTEVANNVSIGLTTVVPGSFVYQTADSSNNPTGTQNTPATIQPGTAQNFIIAFTPSAAFAPTNVALNMSGTNALPELMPVTGLNTLLVSSTSGPGPDIIALAATITPA